MKESIIDTKLYFGPMSKNIVDALISYCNKYSVQLGIVASRRQIEMDGGYANNWTSREFVEYIRNKTDKIIVCRDHGGYYQGHVKDDGFDSLLQDAALGFDIIHIDPWKSNDIEHSIDYTVIAMTKCLNANPKCLFEIGTEQSIFEMDVKHLDYFIRKINRLTGGAFDSIVYAVIQSGTSLKSGVNTGKYDSNRLKEMIAVSQKYGLLSKEHNGDYLSKDLVKEKFDLGLSAINIAPELANLESGVILENIDSTKKDLWFNMCIEDGQWAKWFPSKFIPADNKSRVLSVCGHYVFSRPEFKDVIDLDSISETVSTKIASFINDRI